MTVRSLDIWSEAEQKIVPWTVSVDEETDELGNVSRAIVARHGDEVHRFSPTHDNDELRLRAQEMNEGH